MFSTSFFNKKRLVSVFVLAIVITIILTTISDIDEWIGQSDSNSNNIDLGIIKHCDPMVALCSISTQIDDKEFNHKKLRILLNINQLSDGQFEINLGVSKAINRQNILKQVSVVMAMPGADIIDNKFFLSPISEEKKPDHLSQVTQWKIRLNPPQSVESRSDWLLHFKLVSETYSIQMTYPMNISKYK